LGTFIGNYIDGPPSEILQIKTHPAPAQPDVTGLTVNVDSQSGFEISWSPQVSPVEDLDVCYEIKFSPDSNFSSSSTYWSSTPTITTQDGHYDIGDTVYFAVKAHLGNKSGGYRGYGATGENVDAFGNPSGTVINGSGSANFATTSGILVRNSQLPIKQEFSNPEGGGNRTSFFVLSDTEQIMSFYDYVTFSLFGRTDWTVTELKMCGGNWFYLHPASHLVNPASSGQVSPCSDARPDAVSYDRIRVTLDGNAIEFPVHEYYTKLNSNSSLGALWGGGLSSSSGVLPYNQTDRTPYQIVPEGVDKVSSGDNHMLILKRDGSLWAIGENHDGQFGDAPNYSTDTPIEIVAALQPGLSQINGYRSPEQPFVSHWANGHLWITASGSSSGNTSSANDRGESITVHSSTYPSLAGTWTANSDPRYGSSINGHTYWISPDGTSLLKANSTGYAPVWQMYSIEQNVVVQISAGYGNSHFVKSNGSLWATGRNRSYGGASGGWLGLGDIDDRDSEDFEQVVASGVAQVAAGYEHTLYRTTSGALYGYGESGDGQLGANILANRTTVPEQVVSSDVTYIAAGGNHSLFVKSDGSLWATGKNEHGQLGLGDTIDRSTPEQVVSSGVTQVFTSWTHSLYLTSDGGLYGMGNNSKGQLGLGEGTNSGYPYNTTNPDTTNRTSPVEIVSSGVTHVSGGASWTLFVKNGELWTVGDGYAALHRFRADGSDPRKFTWTSIH
jgi:alpha-tubulin suppressor-like RCC1 family protein